MSVDRDKFQGICLESVEGWKTIEYYDILPPLVKKRIQSSFINICCVCILERTFWSKDDHKIIKYIEWFEDEQRRRDQLL
jgi:hypothetical protein